MINENKEVFRLIVKIKSVIAGRISIKVTRGAAEWTSGLGDDPFKDSLVLAGLLGPNRTGQHDFQLM